MKPGLPPQGDIQPDSDGLVHPGTGGMSVAPEPRLLPKHRRPQTLGGDGRDPVFQMVLIDLPETLRFRSDSESHGLIEPAAAASFELFQSAIHATQVFWVRMASTS